MFSQNVSGRQVLSNTSCFSPLANLNPHSLEMIKQVILDHELEGVTGGMELRENMEM